MSKKPCHLTTKITRLRQVASADPFELFVDQQFRELLGRLGIDGHNRQRLELTRGFFQPLMGSFELIRRPGSSCISGESACETVEILDSF